MPFPGYDWNNKCLKSYCNHPELTHRFCDLLSDNYMEQLVLEPTGGPNILDLFITNNPTLFSKIQAIPGLSDHA